MPHQGGILSQDDQAMPQDMPAEMHRDNTPGMPGGLQQGIQHDNPPDVPGGLQQVIQQDNPPDVPGGLQQVIQQDNPPDVPGGLQQDVQQDNPPGIPGDVLQDMHQDNPSGMPAGMQHDMPQEMLQDGPKGTEGGIQQDIQQDNLQGMPGGRQQDVPTNVLQDNSEGMQGDMPQDNAPGMPHDMPLHMPQDNPPGNQGSMQDMPHVQVLSVPVQEMAEMGIGLRGEEVVYLREEQNETQPQTMRQTVLEDETGVPRLDEMDAGTQFGGGPRAGAQSGDISRAGTHSGIGNLTGAHFGGGTRFRAHSLGGTRARAHFGGGSRVRAHSGGGTRAGAHSGGGNRAEGQSGGGIQTRAYSGARARLEALSRGGPRAGAQSRGGTRAGAQSGARAWAGVLSRGGTRAGAQSRGGTRAGAQSGGRTQAGAQSGCGTRAQTNAGAVARPNTRGGTTVWAQAQYPTNAEATPQREVQDWALLLEEAEAEGQLQEGDWAHLLAEAVMNIPECPHHHQANRRGESGPGPPTGPRQAGGSLTRYGYPFDERRHIFSSCRNVKLITNYFSVNFLRSTPLYQYQVEFKPPCESKRVRTALLYVHQELIGEAHAFNGTMLFLPHRLPNQVTEVQSTRQSDGVQIQLTITLRSELPPDAPQAIQVFNIILRRLLQQLGMEQVQRHHYDFGSSVDINRSPGTILQLIPGVAASILAFDDRVLLNVDLTHKVVRGDTCLDVINREYMIQNSMDDVRRALIGCVVITRYNNRTYRVDDVNDSLAPTDTFRLTNGTTITFQQYFFQRYQITIVDQAQPLLMSRPTARDRRRGQTAPIYLVPELCLITGLSDEMRADFTVMKDVAGHTRIRPSDMVARLQSFRSRLERNQQVRQELENWGFEFSERLLEVRGHVLVKERITSLGNIELFYNPKHADWTHQMECMKLLKSVALTNWLFLFPKKHDQIALHFVQSLAIAGRDLHVQISHPVKIALDDDRNETYLRALRNSVTPDIQIVVCMVSDNKKDRYNAIKRFCTCERPVPCQVVVQKNLAVKQKMMKMIRNIVIQLNCKLGGEAWAVDIPFNYPVMVIGIDTYPDMSMRNWSVCGVVFSLNNICSRLYSRVIFYENYDGLINRLTAICQEALRFQERRGVLPEKIFIYRDGVREGQLDTIISREMPRVKEIFQQYRENYSPCLSFIVVNKRISTRLFLKTTGVENPQPGTVVDTVITGQECFNFFLVSDSTGVVPPTHYTVIWDDTHLQGEHLQRITYKLTHLYYNMPRTIRVPAPCQYAHKLALLAGQSLHREPSIRLADKLYYL